MRIYDCPTRRDFGIAPPCATGTPHFNNGGETFTEGDKQIAVHRIQIFIDSDNVKISTKLDRGLASLLLVDHHQLFRVACFRVE
jgi:hypothetical protein